MSSCDSIENVNSKYDHINKYRGYFHTKITENIFYPQYNGEPIIYIYMSYLYFIYKSKQ